MSMMGCNKVDNWVNLPVRIFIFIAQSFSFLGDFSSYVCNLWRTLVSEFEKLCLPPTSFPLFEDVAPGAIHSDCDYDSNRKYSDVVEKQVRGDNYDNWSNLTPDILHLIVQKFSFLREYYRFIAVCKSWRDSVSKFNKPCLPLTEYPFLLLAEDVAPGAMLEYNPSQDYSDVEDNDDEEEDSGDDDNDSAAAADDDNDGDSGDDDDDEEVSGDDDDKEVSGDDDDKKVSGDDDDEEDDKKDNIKKHIYDHNKNSVGSSRGLYSLLTGKTYYIELPEAAGRLILGTNKGWLVTLGRDLQINLLHPLLNHQISLPPMLAFSRQISYHENYMPEDASDMFIHKVYVSSNILNENTAFGLYHHRASPSPSVMAIYGDCLILGFARLGDKVWTDVKVSSRNFDDIVYHKGNFYAVDCHGRIYVCGRNGDEEGGDIRGIAIASLISNDWEKKYLVESKSGSGLLLLVRYSKDTRFKYRTTHFSVWRLDLIYSDSFEDISCSLKEENDLGNEAIFVGRVSSTAVSSSEIIKPNRIYFTDDNSEGYYHQGGGHDMGIFSMGHHTIEPHFQGKSMHTISPPLWYI